MKFSRNILSTFIDISNIEDHRLYNALNNLGLEVESITNIKVPNNVVIGKVIDKAQHSSANKLNICKVDIGSEILQIVCGAKNVQINQLVAVALIGSTIDGKIIKKSKIRGVDSYGMLCSSTELGLYKIEDGILVLDDSLGNIVLGEQLCKYSLFNDTLFEVDVTPNRGDYLSVMGIARDLSVLFDLEFKDIKENECSNDVIPGIGRIFNINFDDNLHSSLYYKFAKIQKLTDSFKLKFYLSFIDNLSEDILHNITTFATYMTGVLLNVYKIKYISDETKIQFNISIDSNGIESVYYDSSRLYDIGISVNKNYFANQHSDFVVFEASYIPPDYISKLIFNNDCVGDDNNITYISRRGSSPLLESGTIYLCNLLQMMSNSIIYSSSQHIIQNLNRTGIDVYFDSIRAIIGNDVENKLIIDILKKMNFNVSKTSDNNLVIVTPPVYRHDIKDMQDIAEEILRIISIDSIESIPQNFNQYKNIDINFKKYKFKRMVANRAIANKFFECIHYLFVKKDNMSAYGYPILNNDLSISNPITSDLNTLRSSLIPSLVNSAIVNNNRGYDAIALFEIGSIYNENRIESESLAFVVGGNINNPRYPTPKPPKWDFYNFALCVSNIIGKFDLDKGLNHSAYHPNISSNIIINGNIVGKIGKLHPYIEANLNLNIECFICEINFEKLFMCYIPNSLFKETSKYQTSQRDITILIDKNITFKSIKTKILELNISYIKSIVPLDIYESNDFGDKISLSFRIFFQSMDKTLVDDDLKLDSIVDMITNDFGAILK